MQNNIALENDYCCIILKLCFTLVLCLFIFIGHGPFSHLFDALFIPDARPDANWKVNVLQLLVFLPVICSLTRSASSSKYHTRPNNTELYYSPKFPIRISMQ